MTFRSFPAPHSIRAQTPVECWRQACSQPAAPGTRGLCAAHYEQALDDSREDPDRGLSRQLTDER